MKVDYENHVIELTSRNLLSLLAKLGGYPPGSDCTISKSGWMVRAVKDEEHYADREPGPLHPDTEEAICSESK